MGYDKDWTELKAKQFSTDSELVAFVKDVLTKDKADRFKRYSGYLQGYAPFDGMVGIMSQALILGGADADDIKKAMNSIDPKLAVDDIGISGELQTVKKEKPILHLAKITPNMTKDEIRVVAEKMARALLGRPSENGA